VGLQRYDYLIIDNPDTMNAKWIYS